MRIFHCCLFLAACLFFFSESAREQSILFFWLLNVTYDTTRNVGHAKLFCACHGMPAHCCFRNAPPEIDVKGGSCVGVALLVDLSGRRVERIEGKGNWMVKRKYKINGDGGLETERIEARVSIWGSHHYIYISKQWECFLFYSNPFYFFSWEPVPRAGHQLGASKLVTASQQSVEPPKFGESLVL